MFRRSKRKAKAEAATAEPAPGQAQVTITPPPAGSTQHMELQVFDGKGHAATMVFSSKGGRVNQQLRRSRDFGAKLPHVHR